MYKETELTQNSQLRFKHNFTIVIIFNLMPIPMAERFKVRVCGRSLGKIAGSNPAGGTDVCLF